MLKYGSIEITKLGDRDFRAKTIFSNGLFIGTIQTHGSTQQEAKSELLEFLNITIFQKNYIKNYTKKIKNHIFMELKKISTGR